MRHYACVIIEMLIVALSKVISKNGGIFMSTKLTIQDLANWFLAKESMTHKKLQKLCYYAVAWGYALTDKEIIKDGEFQAWIHGPVSRALYDTYKDSGWNLLPIYKGLLNFPDNIVEILESVWLTYGDKGGNELEALSHSEKPWIEARGGLADSERTCNPINVNVMREFYTSIKSTEY